jgi:hypothetical protein
MTISSLTPMDNQNFSGNLTKVLDKIGLVATLIHLPLKLQQIVGQYHIQTLAVADLVTNKRPTAYKFESYDLVHFQI